MNLRVIKKDGKAYFELPQEFAEQDNIELFRLKDGYYLLSFQLSNSFSFQEKKSQPSERVKLSDNDKRILDRLSSIKFEQRTPQQLERMLSTDEKKWLKSLLDRNYVNIYRSKKYPNGVYNISNLIYPLLRQYSTNKTPLQQFKTSASSQAKVTLSTNRDPLYAQLQQTGFIVIHPSAEPSDMMTKEVRRGNIIGVKSFDGKTYAVTKEFFTRLAKSIHNLLNKDTSVDEIAKTCCVDIDGCRAVLAILSERGEVLERKKNIFVLV